MRCRHRAAIKPRDCAVSADRPARRSRAGRFGWVLLAVCCLAYLGLGPAMGRAAAPPVPRWELSAESMSHQRDPRRVIAEGDVVLSRPAIHGEPLVITADRMVYDPENGQVEAVGRVRIESFNEEVAAAAVALHLESQTGTLTRATIHVVDSGIYLKGEHIEKTGTDSYYLEDAWLSSCRPVDDCRTPWAVRSRRARLTVDGLAHLYHPSFQVKELPAAYFPYLVLPVNTRRQSGFLYPELSRSNRDGTGFALPYFIDLSPSADFTLYPRYMDRRGLLVGVEFRYAAGPESRGMLQFSFLPDRRDETSEDDYRADGRLRDTDNRYWLRGKADHDFGDDLLLRLDLDLVSDQDFIMEFNSGLMGYNRANRDFKETFDRDLREPSLATRVSTVQLFRATPTTLLAGELMVQRDSRHRQRLDNQGNIRPWRPSASPLQALPRLHASGRAPLRQWPFSLAWSNEYVHYWRSEGPGAHRLDLHPQLITPLPRGRGWTEGRATVGVRQTMYQVTAHGDHQWPHDRYQDRTAVDFQANLATTLVRDFSLGRGRRAADQAGTLGFEHMVRPNLIYTYVGRGGEGQLPELDSVDRLLRKNWLTYELNNYFEIHGDSWSRPLAYFKVTQTYDIDEGRGDPPGGERRREFSDLVFDLRAEPTPRLDLRYQTNLSMYGAGITRYELQGGYALPAGARLALNYRYLKYSAMEEPYFHTTAGEQHHDIRAGFTAPVGDSLSLRGLLNQSLTDNHIPEASFGLTYHPDCWAVDLEMRRYVDEKSFMITFTLNNIGDALRLRKGGL